MFLFFNRKAHFGKKTMCKITDYLSNNKKTGRQM